MNNRLLQAAKVGAACLLLATLLSQLPDWHFMFDNLSNFRVQLAAAFLACAVALVIAHSGRWLLACGIGLAINLAPVVPWYVPDERAAGGGTTGIEVLVANVYLRNRNYGSLARLIDEIRPDVVGLVEVNSQWLASIPALREQYAYRFEAPQDAYTGLALYSKLPLSDARIVRFGATATPAIVSTLRMPRGEVEVILAHPLPPMDSMLAERRNAQLREMAGYVRKARRPVLLAGDLNSAMWNRNHRSFAERAGLRNARAGHGAAPTWPPLPAVGLPLDHIMGTAPLQLAGFRVHRSIGSDHLPISARIGLPPGRTAGSSGDVTGSLPGN